MNPSSSVISELNQFILQQLQSFHTNNNTNNSNDNTNSNNSSIPIPAALISLDHIVLANNNNNKQQHPLLTLIQSINTNNTNSDSAATQPAIDTTADNNIDTNITLLNKELSITLQEYFNNNTSKFTNINNSINNYLSTHPNIAELLSLLDRWPIDKITIEIKNRFYSILNELILSPNGNPNNKLKKRITNLKLLYNKNQYSSSNSNSNSNRNTNNNNNNNRISTRNSNEELMPFDPDGNNLTKRSIYRNNNNNSNNSNKRFKRNNPITGNISDSDRDSDMANTDNNNHNNNNSILNTDELITSSISSSILAESLPFPLSGNNGELLPILATGTYPIYWTNQLDNENPLNSYLHSSTHIFHPSAVIESDDVFLRTGCNCPAGKCYPDRCSCSNNNSLLKYTNDGRLKKYLQDRYLTECCSNCTCAGIDVEYQCNNRIVQLSPVGEKLQLELYKTRDRGWAVRTLTTIKRGTYICEYIGEVLSELVADLRGPGRDNYLWTPEQHLITDDEWINRDDYNVYTIDACEVGNIARFINHSCIPNCVAVQCLIQYSDPRLPRIAFFAEKEIKSLTELTVNYNYSRWPFTCYCELCRGNKWKKGDVITDKE